MNIEEILPFVNRPSRYLGNEYNVIKKDWQAVKLRIALAFPDLYEIGMSHQGLKILYHILNRQDDYLAERVYAPDLDMEKILRDKGIPLFSLESEHPLADFDMLGITLPYELCYTNILTILDLAGIPLLSRDRDRHPLVIGGGPCAFHPEPVADFFDAILLGDGEEAVLEIARCILAAKEAKSSRMETLEGLSRITGVYVPAFFAPQYDANGRLREIKSLGHAKKVRRAVLAELDSQPISRPLVPLTRIVHDRLGLELARGCTRGCRFCQAGMIYRPVREVAPARVMEIARAGIEAGGFDELALLSLSTGDYSCLAPLLVELMNTFVAQKVSVSMPSMRVGTLTPEIMEQVKRVRKSGFTIAPEAGTDRLRRVINKGISEEDLLDTVQNAFALGWKVIKLYFMFGLPLETEEDITAIPELAAKALRISGRGGNINVSVGTFVPKPHTPFQWEPQISIAKAWERINTLKKAMPRGAKLKWNDPQTSFMEGVFSRGDRRLSSLILEAWQRGARLDAWSEHFDLSLWQGAASTLGIDLDDYLRGRELDEVLPWQHLDDGLEPDFLLRELGRAKEEAYTPDCRVHGCQKCGLCDFKTIKPVIHRGELPKAGVVKAAPQAANGSYYYWFTYERRGKSRFVGHLEFLQALFRAVKRAGLPVKFSQGFNPSPNIAFSPALPVGMESLAEYFIAELAGPLTDLPLWQERLNAQMPEGFRILAVCLGAKSQSARIITDYRITLPVQVSEERLADFWTAGNYPISLMRKRKRRTLDARPQVRGLQLLDPYTLILSMATETSKAGVKPLEFIKALFDLTADHILRAGIIKLSWGKDGS
ncbi:MAG: TIGR03960 family B12-binding radical SAM protein [Deltaproteobacteria bacterium]|nr:TIGR03960 family B12-binding radical SAM protein [Deltaproteobacteria bacterium]